MKKWILGVIASVFIVALTVVVLSTAGIGHAEKISEEFQMDGNILVKYYGQDDLCIIPSSVKKIASSAFEGNEYVKRVVFPDALEEIDYNAFSKLPLLESVIIPDSVTKIGSSAFADCPSLSSVFIGSGVKDLGACPFVGCPLLKDFEVSNLNENLTCVDGVIYSADRSILYEMLPGREKEFFVFPDSVVSISPYAFWGCDNLLYITVSDNVKSVPSYAFSNAKGLLSVSLSFNTTEIGMKAFADCSNLVQVYVPDSCSYIHKSAFDGCPSLQLYVTQGSAPDKFASENNIEVMYSPRFDLDMASVSRDKYAQNQLIARQESKKEEVYNPENDDSMAYTYLVNNEAVVIMDPGKMEVLSNKTDSFDEILLNGIIDNSIPEKIFYKNKDIKNINIPEGVTEIGKFAFGRSALTEVVIPEGVETIGYGAFYHCDDLEKVSIPSSVKVIEKNAFNKTLWLENWMKSDEDDYLIVGDGILLAYKGDKDSFVMPENVKYVSCDID